MTDVAPALRARILIAINPAQVRIAPIEAAARLARDRGMDLTAMVIEELSYLRVAALPFTREFRLASGQWQAYESGEVESNFREHAARARKLVAEVCSRFDLRFSIQIERGAFPARALEQAQAVDWLILDRAVAGLNTRAGYRRVALVFDGSPASVRALAAAGSLAHDGHLPLRVVLLHDDVQTLPTLRGQVRAAIDPAWPLSFAQLEPAQAGEPSRLRQALADGGGNTLLVLPERWVPADAAAMGAALACTVLLIR